MDYKAAVEKGIVDGWDAFQKEPSINLLLSEESVEQHVKIMRYAKLAYERGFNNGVAHIAISLMQEMLMNKKEPR